VDGFYIYKCLPLSFVCVLCASNRLIFIAQRCPELQVEAIELAIRLLKLTKNTNLYMDAVKVATKLNAKVKSQYLLIDQTWVNRITKEATLLVNKLRAILTQDRKNPIREKIRVCLCALVCVCVCVPDYIYVCICVLCVFCVFCAFVTTAASAAHVSSLADAHRWVISI